MTRVVARDLHEKQKAIGYVTIDFLSFWDNFESIPKLYAQSIHFGMDPLFSSISYLGIATKKPSSMPQSLIPKLPEGKYSIYIPLAFHEPLKATRDDVFLKFCRMHGIVYNTENANGTLFFLIDSVVSGSVSILAISDSKIKSLETAILTLQFISQRFGKEKAQESVCKKWDNLTFIMKKLMYILKTEKSTTAGK